MSPLPTSTNPHCRYFLVSNAFHPFLDEAEPPVPFGFFERQPAYLCGVFLELVFLQECKTERKTDKSDEVTYIERLEPFIAFNRLFWNEIYLARLFATPCLFNKDALSVIYFCRTMLIMNTFLCSPLRVSSNLATISPKVNSTGYSK